MLYEKFIKLEVNRAEGFALAKYWLRHNLFERAAFKSHNWDRLALSKGINVGSTYSVKPPWTGYLLKVWVKSIQNRLNINSMVTCI